MDPIHLLTNSTSLEQDYAMKTFLWITIIVLFVFSGCSKEDPAGPGIPPVSFEKALIVVLENNDMFPAILYSLYPVIKSTVDPKLAELFGVPIDSLKSKDITQIVGIYGQDWLIRRIVQAASKYESVTMLTRTTSTLNDFMAALRIQKSHGRVIDVLLDLHANENGVCFQQDPIPIHQLTDSVKNAGIRIRALYQTCCYSSNHLSAWSETGIVAVCGSVMENSLTVFAPVVFLELFTSGTPYKTAVERAYAQDLDSMKVYDAKLGLSGFLLPSQQQIDDSRQVIAGTNPFTTFNDAVTLVKLPAYVAAR
jgi:hypothetical protein